MSILPPSPFIGSATAETLPSESSGKDHHSGGRPFSIDEEEFFHLIDPPPLPREHVNEDDIEQILRALFARTA
jgi:hypothetical protein